MAVSALMNTTATNAVAPVTGNGASTLPVVPGSPPEKDKLPDTYIAAVKALSECVRVDEAKDWADKAAALASYAKQAKDRRLLKLAKRIHMRAVRRQGELLKELQPQPGRRTDLQPYGGAPTRLQAATSAGLSRDQMVTAVRVASVPESTFTAAVESENPPTVSALALLGKRSAAPTESNGDDHLPESDPSSWRRQINQLTNLHGLPQPAEFAKQVLAAGIALTADELAAFATMASWYAEVARLLKELQA
jgi:hypothetical protein